jgi:hypothetical protein
MNICGGGICVCDNYDYGDEGCEQMYQPFPTPDRNNYDPRYYFDRDKGVCLSVNHPSEMQPGVDYFLTPDEAMRHARDITVKEALERGFLSPEQAAELNSLRPVTGHTPEAKPSGPQGQRRRVFPIKPKS